MGSLPAAPPAWGIRWATVAIGCEWVYDLASWRERHGLEGGETNKDAEILDQSFANTGAFVMGRRMFDEGEGSWGDNPPFHMPVFVVTHHVRDTLVKEGETTFFFVTGVDAAKEQATQAAGDKDVSVAGGADVIQQLLKAGLLTSCRFTSFPCCSATESGYSTGWAPTTSSW
jgi:dihydrofolate reductase